MSDGGEKDTAGAGRQGTIGEETAAMAADLDAIQQEVGKRIRDNRRFLARFMDEDFMDEDFMDEDFEDEDERGEDVEGEGDADGE